MSEARPDVSVVIAAWNAESRIATAIESAHRQRGVKLEVIVSDDASTDATVNVARALCRPSDRVLVADRNGGPGAARNRGFRSARGRWIAVLDADDGMEPNRLERMFRLGDFREADIVVDDLLPVTEDGKTLPPFFGERLQSIETMILPDLLGSDALFSSRPGFGYTKPLFRRDFLKRARLAYDPTLRIGEDFALFADCLAADALAVVDPNAGYLYTRHSGSTSHRLGLAEIRAMREAEERFVRRWPLTSEAAAAMAKRGRALDNAEAFVTAVEAIKTRRWLSAVMALAGKPGALAIFRYPAAARLSRGLRRMARRSTTPVRDPSTAG